jgi:hypothetical protein
MTTSIDVRAVCRKVVNEVLICSGTEYCEHEDGFHGLECPANRRGEVTDEFIKLVAPLIEALYRTILALEQHDLEHCNCKMIASESRVALAEFEKAGK